MTTPNPLFTERLTPYEQYIMFIGYMDRLHQDMCIKSGDDKMSHKIDQMVMAILNKKVVDMLFPDGKHDIEQIKYIGSEMHKLRMGDRVEEMLDQITSVLSKYRKVDVSNRDQIKEIMKELFRT